MDDLFDNPFAQLFPTIKDAEQFIENEAHSFAKGKVDRLLVNNEMIEKSLLVTFDKDQQLSHPRPKYLIYMSDLHQSCQNQEWICLEQLDQVLCERNILCGEKIHPITMESGFTIKVGLATERQILCYYFRSFGRVVQMRHDYREHWFPLAALEIIHAAVVRQSALQLINSCQMEDFAYTGQITALIDEVDRDTPEDMHTLLDWFQAVLSQLVTLCAQEEQDSRLLLSRVMSPVWPALVPPSVDWDQLCTVELKTLALRLDIFIRTPEIAELLLEYCTPISPSAEHPVAGAPSSVEGRVFGTSPLGLLLRPSHLAAGEAAKSQFFNSAIRQEVEFDETQVIQMTQRNRSLAGEVFLNLLRAGTSRPQVKTKLFRWIGACLSANSARAQLGQSLHSAPVRDPRLVPDGFLINLFAVLCRLSGPLLDPTSTGALAKIQTQLVSEEKRHLISLPGLSKETRLGVAAGDNSSANNNQASLLEGDLEGGGCSSLQTAEPHYSALSHLFFLLHKSFRLSFCPLSDRFVTLNRQNHELEQAWQSVQAEGASESPTGQYLRRMMQSSLATYLSHQTALSDPDLGRAAFGLLLFTAEFLTSLAGTAKSDAMPEFLVDNIVEFAIFMRRFKDQGFEEYNFSLAPLFHFVVVFMGSTERLKNPHLRAKLAEVLEALLPFREDKQTSQAVISFTLRDQLLTSHPLLDRVVRSLITAFVTIELTGEGVNFEEKFAYRRPMYACMRYFHEKPQFDSQFKVLETDALTNIDAPEAPLFLRFLNLLINDAIYLLDEALQHLALIKGLEATRAGHPSGRFPSQQEEGNFRHEGMLARYHVTMGRDTLDQLVRMAGFCSSILLHPVLVDRVAAMLNYFLVKLVGPKKREFAVRDKEAYKFSPADLLTTIARLYTLLGADDKDGGGSAFLSAVVRDDRSYSADLLQATGHLLGSSRLHAPIDLVEEFAHLTERLVSVGAAMAEDEAVLEEAPEEFLDEIMGSVMRDPVLLPTSGQTVDRSTIARHLLSDTTDPFNRQPLTMSMVVPQDALREKITTWIETKKSQRSRPGPSSSS